MSAPSQLPGVIDLVLEAGRAVMKVYGRDDFGTRNKDNDSPLTEADLAANRILVAGLSELTPDIPVLSEESAAAPYDQRRDWTQLWLVDPLDGTKEFIKRNGEFTVNVALVRGGTPIMGVVHAPARNLTFWGGPDGAFIREGDHPARSITVTTPRDGEAMRVVVSRSHPSPTLEAFLNELGPHEQVPMGSSLKLCLVASGDAHLYPRLGPTMEWDTAAAHAVVNAAGGRVTTPAGQPLHYNKADLLNPHFIVIGTVSGTSFPSA